MKTGLLFIDKSPCSHPFGSSIDCGAVKWEVLSLSSSLAFFFCRNYRSTADLDPDVIRAAE